MPGGTLSILQRYWRSSADCTTSLSQNGGGTRWWWWMVWSMTSPYMYMVSRPSQYPYACRPIPPVCVPISLLLKLLFPLLTSLERGKKPHPDLGSERERVALYALQFQEQVLVPEHVETRTLYNPAQPGISQVTMVKNVEHSPIVQGVNLISADDFIGKGFGIPGY